MSEGSSTVDKAVRVLEVLQHQGAALALGDIARAVELPKPTVHRMLQSLAAHDLVESDGEGRYALGVGLVRLGLGALSQSPVQHVARPELERAASELGETFFLVAARAGRLWILERAEGRAMLRAVPSLGAEVPAAETASGRLYAAFAPELLQEADLATARRFPAQLERARVQGYDINDGEWFEGLWVTAAPILAGGTLHGCVACAGARESFAGAAGKRAVRHTRAVAERIGIQLGGEARPRRTA